MIMESDIKIRISNISVQIDVTATDEFGFVLAVFLLIIVFSIEFFLILKVILEIGIQCIPTDNTFWRIFYVI